MTLAEKNELIVKSWDWGMIYGFFYESSLYDASPLFNFIWDYFHDAKFYRHLNLGIADVLDGRFKSFKHTHGAEELVSVL